MEIMIGEKSGHLADELVEELISLLVGRVHRGIENAPFALNLVWPGSARQLWMANKPRRTVARHVEFRHYTNAAVARIRNQVANLVLRVVQPVRTQSVQLGKFLALDAEALIFRKMPMENVHLRRFKAVQIALEYIERNKVAAYVDHQPTPGKARLVMNDERRSGEAVRRDFHQLQKCLQPVHGAQRRWRFDLRAICRNRQRVALVFAEFLNLFAGVARVHGQRRLGGGVGGKRQPSFTLELPQETLHRAVQPRFSV